MIVIILTPQAQWLTKLAAKFSCSLQPAMAGPLPRKVAVGLITSGKSKSELLHGKELGALELLVVGNSIV